jgi:hypothetical protein
MHCGTHSSAALAAAAAGSASYLLLLLLLLLLPFSLQTVHQPYLLKATPHSDPAAFQLAAHHASADPCCSMWLH